MKALEEIRPKIKSLDAIPAVPAIVHPLISMLQLPPDKVEIEKIVELVSCDAGIAAQCLRMSNSPLFSRRNTESVRSAIMALGLKRVQAILLGCCLNKIVPPGKWALDATTFWRHALGCALVSRKLATLIGYPDPEKAYLAGLLHDLGVLVNNIACTEQYRECLRVAHETHAALDQVEAELLGFTHCQSGKILAQQWRFSADVVEVVEFHHEAVAAPTAGALVALIHLSDLLCRLRDLGYGYYESVGVNLAEDDCWPILAKHCPALASMDLARLTMDIDGAMDDIVSLVDAVFKPEAAALA
ncbi:MAG TPA: HDOD domain-containing protein [Candidatus Sulfotelmatobacter sp.]|jgi:HD-like signal output (HDOD) protein|nr:HDOD domain-containing protein [Candidatus Sulfotelmatobacter sp.]